MAEPQDFVAYPSRWRIAGLMLLCSGFVAMGLWMTGAFGEVPQTRHPATYTRAVGWVSVLFFGVCTLGGLRRFFDSREELRIGPAGIRHTLRSEATIPWSAISGVTTWHHHRQRMIVLHLSDPALFPAKGVFSKLEVLNRGLTGGDVSISLIGTNRSFSEAMAAIEAHRP